MTDHEALEVDGGRSPLAPAGLRDRRARVPVVPDRAHQRAGERRSRVQRIAVSDGATGGGERTGRHRDGGEGELAQAEKHTGEGEEHLAIGTPDGGRARARTKGSGAAAQDQH